MASGRVTEKLVRAFFDEALNARDVAALHRFCAPHYLWHGMAGAEVHGLEAFAAEVKAFFDAFPDISIVLLDVVSSGDRAAVRFRESGTHLGALSDVAPTGEVVSWDGMAIYRADEGLLVEEWSVSDRLALLQGIGAPLRAPAQPIPRSAEARSRRDPAMERGRTA